MAAPIQDGQPRKRRAPTVADAEIAFRWFLYLGFAASVIWALVTLSTGGPWVASVFGTFVFGALSFGSYIRATEHAHTLRANEAHAARASQQGEGGWTVGGLDQPGDGGQIQ
jgi:hypothetical protein